MTNTNTKQEAESFVDRFLANSKTQTTFTYAKVLARILQILAPVALSVYLITKYNDKIVVGLGVAAGLYALLSLAKTAYKAECNSKKRR